MRIVPRGGDRRRDHDLAARRRCISSAPRVKRRPACRWVADLRDSLVAHPHRDAQRLPCARRSRAHQMVARLVALAGRRDRRRLGGDRRGDARARPRGPVVHDRERLRLRRLRRARVLARVRAGRPPFRITHAGSFFGKRDPRPFLTALARVDGVVARFVGDFRADRPRVGGSGHRRPHRADPVRAAPPLARAAARLRGAAAADPGGRRPRPRRALREGLRVPRRRAADPRARAARRRRGAAARARRAPASSSRPTTSTGSRAS